MTQLVIDAFGPTRNEALSQFYTPPAVATRMVNSVGDVKLWRVLEPSCGLGALVKPMLLRGSGRLLSESMRHPMVIDAVDIDERNIEWCRENILSSDNERVAFECCDYLERPAPMDAFYCLGIANPPYEDGKDGLFLAKMMHECIRVVALIRTESLHGVGRYEQVWSKCDGIDSPWIVRSVSLNVRRVNFGGGGGMIETTIVKMSRRGEHDDGVTSCVGWLP